MDLSLLNPCPWGTHSKGLVHKIWWYKEGFLVEEFCWWKLHAPRCWHPLSKVLLVRGFVSYLSLLFEFKLNLNLNSKWSIDGVYQKGGAWIKRKISSHFFHWGFYQRIESWCPFPCFCAPISSLMTPSKKNERREKKRGKGKSEWVLSSIFSPPPFFLLAWWSVATFYFAS